MNKHRQRAAGRDERGATLALVAVAMLALLGMAALAVDMSAAFAWRAEAQKIADAAALAGGSAYMDNATPAAAVPDVNARAYDYALRHTIKGVPVDSAEVTVQPIPDSMKVRVAINRADMPTWFARTLGFDGVDIGAVAAAQAFLGGTAQCLKPWALPDLWDEQGPPLGNGQDDDGDNVWDSGEEWAYDGSEDMYVPFDGSNQGTATGYGSYLRDLNGDWGRPVQLKASDPNDEYTAAPGIFYPWRIPEDTLQAPCDQGGGGGNDSGGAAYRQNICECNDNVIELGQPYPVEPGNMIGPTQQGVKELINEDPDVRWNSSLDGGLGGLERLEGGSWVPIGLATPRVIKVALMDPGQITGSGMQNIVFNNFALMFLESQGTGQDPVTARFLYFTGGGPGSAGGPTGSLVLFLRLVE